MKDVYKDLMLLEDEQEEQEKDIIFDELHSLTHLYKDDEDEGTVEVPWYCFLESVASDFGYDYQEMINLVKSSPDYIVFKIHPVGSFNGAICIGAKGLDLDMVKEDIKKMCEDDFGDEDVEVKISFKENESIDSKHGDVDNAPYVVIADDEKFAFDTDYEAKSFMKRNEYSFDKLEFVDNTIKESKLDDLKVSSYKYLLDVYDRDDNFIERKFFRSRPEADKFVDAMEDLFDIKISNNEVVELKNGKDFFGTYWKVIRDLKKDESLKEESKTGQLKYGIFIHYANNKSDTYGLTFDDLEKAKEKCVELIRKASKDYKGKNFITSCDILDLDTKKHDIVDTIDSSSLEESLKEALDDEVIEETNEYKIVKTIQHNFKTVKGVAKKGKDKVIYQVYFRTQDFNPSTNRWQDSGWSNSTSEFDSVEDARAFVKKYGKKLKVEESLKELGFEIKLDESCDTISAITKESSQNSDSFNEYIDRIEEAFEHLREREGYPCTFNVGLQNDGYIICNVELKENCESAIEEDIEKHDTLNPKLFDGEELKPAVAKAIMNIANEFVKELGEDGISFTLKDVILLGSNMSYNYTKDSDLDIHLIADSSALECPKELVDKLYGAYRTIFNKNYDITIKGIPAEVYVELDEPQAKSNGIYSLNSGWVKKPIQQDIPDLDKEAFNKKFKVWEDRYNDLVNNENATSEDVDQYINDIYAQRKEGIANEGEYSLGNLLFKEVRNKGYLDNLKDLRKELKGKELSLENLEEDAEVGEEATLENVRKWLKTGGATLNNKTKKAVVYKDGYEISFNEPEEKIKVNLDKDDDIQKVIDALNRRFEENKHPYTGIWYEDDSVVMDYSKHFKGSKEDAIKDAIKNNQRMIFNWGYTNENDKYISAIDNK